MGQFLYGYVPVMLSGVQEILFFVPDEKIQDS